MNAVKRVISSLAIFGETSPWGASALVLSAGVLFVGAAPVRAQAVLKFNYATSYSQAQDAAVFEGTVKEWLRLEPGLKRKLQPTPRILPTGMGSMPAAADDLRDAPAAMPVSIPSAAGARPPGYQRPLMERLPGYEASPFATCRILSGCPVAPTAFVVSEARQIQDAVGAILRPWILLQQSRGEELRLAKSADAGDRMLKVGLGGNPGVRLDVYVSAGRDGFYRVWLGGNTDPAQLYVRERSLALAE